MQMACTHTAAMAVLGTLGGAHGSNRNVAAKASAAARLLRAFVAQVEVLRRLRNGGSQFVRVEHVHVNDGGQAVVGNVRSTRWKTPPQLSRPHSPRMLGCIWIEMGGTPALSSCR